MSRFSRTFYLHLLLFLLGCTGIYAQEHKSEDDNYSRARYTTAWFLDRGSDSLLAEDSSLDFFHLYQPLLRHNFSFGDLGNSGTPTQLLYLPLPSAGFDHGFHYLDYYLFDSKDAGKRYYKVQKPMSRFVYNQGRNELINLKAIHTQNIRNNWNVGVEFNRLKSNGFYLRQNTSYYNTRIFNWFHSRDYRYMLFADAVFNRVRNQESGGVISEDAFDTLTGPVRQAQVKYYGESGTTEARNIVRTNAVTLRQYYRFGRNHYFPTEALDSFGKPVPDTIPTFIPASQIMLETGFNRYRNILTINELEGIGFTNYYRDSASTYDSFFMSESWVRGAFQSGQYALKTSDFKGNKQLLSYESGFMIHRIKPGWNEDYAAYNNVSVFGRLGLNPFRSTEGKLEVKGSYYVHGYNNGDLEASVFAERKLGKVYIAGEQIVTLREPSFNAFYFFSNQAFWWNRGLEKTAYSASRLALRMQHDQQALLMVELANTTNYIYFDSTSVARQYSGNLQVLRFQAEKKLNYRKLYFYNRLVYQEGDIKTVLRLPSFTWHSSLFVEGLLFKKALFAKIGADLFYVSSYKAGIYNPVTRQFQLQDTISVGNHPYINLHFTGKIRTFTFFLMMQHVNMGIFGGKPYSSPLYPLEPRAFRFGVRWDLYN